MLHQDSLPVYPKMLRRPRLYPLIQDGLSCPLLLVLAGPGYGKTQALSDCLMNHDAPISWLRLNHLDNLPNYFWDHMLRALRQEFPLVAEQLQSMAFPDSLYTFHAFLNVLQKHIVGPKQAVWVFDDYASITDERICQFFEMLAEAALDNLRLVLISNDLSHNQSTAAIAQNHTCILAKDLCFTSQEIAQLYHMYDISLSAEELFQVQSYTEGWPLSLHLCVLHHDDLPVQIHQEKKWTHESISRMFEERFFSHYPRQQKILFVQLSLLDCFSKELALQLYEGDKFEFELDSLKNHVFLTYESANDQFSFHNLYRLFLQKKQYLLRAEQVQSLWKQAAQYYETIENTAEAIVCYCKCKDYVSMLRTISHFAKTQHGINRENAAYFLKHLHLLTPAQLQAYPVADYLKALIYMNTLELEKSEALLLDLEQRLLRSGTAEALALLGDAYAVLGCIHMMRNQEDFGDYYRKAAFYLPHGTNFKSENKLLTQNNHNFSMADKHPGAKERMEQAVHYGVPWMARVLSGGMSGMEHIFSSEAAYLSGDLPAAEQHAYRAIYKAETNAQHDLVCNGYCLLARIGLLQGDFKEMSLHVEHIVDYAKRYEIGALKEIRDTALGWYYAKLRDHDKIPQSILKYDYPSKPMLTYGRQQIVYANYLINTGSYAELIGMLEHPRGLYLTRGIWPDRICLYIMLAIGYERLGQQDPAMAALWKAYDMSCHNGLTTLFAEAGTHMLHLLSLARTQSAHAFEPAWLAQIETLSQAYAQQLSRVRSAYQKEHLLAPGKSNPLTRREREILQSLSGGLTRQEIAAAHFVSINTVKSFIRSIYNKLNAANRAEAVSIAISRGYIDLSSPQ